MAKRNNTPLKLSRIGIVLPLLSILASPCLFANDRSELEYTEMKNTAQQQLLVIYPQNYKPGQSEDFDWTPTYNGFRIRESEFYRLLGDNLKADLILPLEKAREERHNTTTLLYFAYVGVATLVSGGGLVFFLNGQNEKNEGKIISGGFGITVGVLLGFTSLFSLLGHSIEDYDKPRIYSRKDAENRLDEELSR